MSSHLQAALNYAELGYRVFPCVPGGKEPACEHGCLDATGDAERITAWWTRHPECNVAVSTDGLFVLDIDPAGKKWLATVDAGGLMQGAITATPRGGIHYWFRQGDGDELRNTTGKIAEGVDTRATGGYVLVPPSIVGDKAYHWVSEPEGTLPVAPRWLVELLGVRVPLRESVGDVIPEGNRNHAVFRFAGFFRRSGMSETEILHAIRGINTVRCQPPLPDRELLLMARSAARFAPDTIQENTILNHLGGNGQPPDDEETPDAVQAVFPAECLKTMPGVMREAWDWMMLGAVLPQPELTLGALVALFGACFGRKVCDDYDTRTNVMVLSLAGSGMGKEWPRQANKQLLLHAELPLINAPERIGSHAGIISAVHHHPVRLFQLDEIGRLLATMRDPKASHLYNVGTVLMALYSSSNTLWTGDAYADLDKVKSINQPHVCVYGTSVPESLYSGLSPDNLTDGLVGRLLVFQALDVPKRQKPKGKSGLPWRAVETLRYWATELLPPDSGNLVPMPIEATKTPEADTRHEGYCNEINKRHQAEDNVSASIWARAPEKAAKLALIHACCEASGNPPAPVITLAAENWGIALANYSTRLVLSAARGAIAGSKYEADLKFVFAAINSDITLNALTRKTQRLKRRDRAEILSDLIGTGAIEQVEIDTGKRPKTVYRRRRNTL